MSKINQSTAKRIRSQATEVTFERGVAFKKDYQMELYQLVSSCFLGENTFYATADQRKKRIVTLIHDIVTRDGFGGAKFVANLAVYARTKMNLRTVSVYLVAALANSVENASDATKAQVRNAGIIRRATYDVICRADEIREMLAAAKLFAKNGKLGSASKAIKKGIADAFGKFNEYHFAKYSGGSGAIGMDDAIRIIRPVPLNEERAGLYKNVRHNTLATAETWETVISAEGEKESPNFQAAWESIIPEMGYMALLRNLNNLHKYGVLSGDTRKYVIERLSNRDAVLKSKQLPFRFLSAIKATQEAGVYDPFVIKALEDAFEVSCERVPNLGNCLIFVDTSGSMQCPVSGKSKMSLAETAGCLAAILWKSQVGYGHDVSVYQFATDASKYGPSANTTALEFAKKIQQSIGEVGHGTDLTMGLMLAEHNKENPDFIFVFSDNQMANQSVPFVEKGRQLRSRNPKVYSIDLAGYANTPLAAQNGVYQLAGFSDKLFELVEAMENPEGAIKEIMGMS